MYVGEPVRDSAHYYAQNFGPDLCVEVFALHLLTESRASFHSNVLILDRSLLDLLVFFRMKYMDNTDPGLFKRMEEFSLSHIASYEHTFLFGNESFDEKLDQFQLIDQFDPEKFSITSRNILNCNDLTYTEVQRSTASTIAFETITSIIQ